MPSLRHVFAFALVASTAAAVTPEGAGALAAPMAGIAKSFTEHVSGNVVQVARRRVTPPTEGAVEAPEAGPAAPTTPDGMSKLSGPRVPDVPPLPKREEGPRHTLENCMKLWDAETHMSKSEWRTTCKRSIREQEKARKADEARRAAEQRNPSKRGVGLTNPVR